MKVERIKKVETINWFPCEVYREERKLPYHIDRDSYQEAASREEHEKYINDFIDDIYAARPKGYAVVNDNDNFGYMLPEEAEKRHKRMWSRTQLKKLAFGSYKLSNSNKYIAGDYYVIIWSSCDVQYEVKKTTCSGTGSIYTTNIPALKNKSYSLEDYVHDYDVFATNIPGVILYKDYSQANILFTEQNVAEEYLSQVKRGDFSELEKMAVDGYAAIRRLEKAEKDAAEKEEAVSLAKAEAERQAKEAERLSKINKDALPVENLEFGKTYYAIDGDKSTRFIYANLIDGKRFGVKQIWEGSSYDETLNAYMEWVEVVGPVFASWQDVYDYMRLSNPE